MVLTEMRLEKRAPLIGHSVSDTGERTAAIFPSLRRGRLPMNASTSTLNNVSRGKRRQILEPQAGSFNFTVAKHPRLNNLVWLPDSTADNTDWIFQSNAIGGCVQKVANKLQCSGLLNQLIPEPAGSTDGKVSAGRMRDQQIPLTLKQGQDIASDVIAASLCRQQVTGDSVMSSRNKRITHDPTELTGNQDFAHGAIIH